MMTLKLDQEDAAEPTVTPAGIVGIVIAVDDGHTIASACDFSGSGYGGFKQHETQRLRVRQALADNLVQRGCNGLIAKGLSGHYAEQLLDRMVSKKLCRIHYEAVGYDENIKREINR
jgi:hypothetical protein